MNQPAKTLEALLLAIYQLLQKGDADAALDAINKLKKDQPAHAKVLQLEALILRKKGYLDRAIESLIASLALDENSAEAHNSLANVYMEKQSWSESIAHYQAAIKLAPSYVEARRNMGLCYSAQGSLELAKKTFKEILDKRPNDVSTRVALANLERDENQFELAEQHYVHALEIENDHYNALVNRGINARLGADLSLAKRCFENAQQQKNSESVVVSLANIEAETGNVELAMSQLRSFLVSSPQAVQAHKNLDKLFWEYGDLSLIHI